MKSSMGFYVLTVTMASVFAVWAADTRASAANAKQTVDTMVTLAATGLTGKLPLSNAADVHAIHEAKRIMSGTAPVLMIMALWCCHQLWTPVRVVLFAETFMAHGTLQATITALQGEPRMYDVGNESNLIPGLCVSWTKLEIIAAWVAKPAKHSLLEKAAQEILALFQDVSEQSMTKCLQALRKIFGVGEYISSHGVRAIASAYQICIPLSLGWGSYTFSDRSVGQILRILGNSSPSAVMHLLIQAGLPQHLQGPLQDIGCLTLLMCETHQVMSHRDQLGMSQSEFEAMVSMMDVTQIVHDAQTACDMPVHIRYLSAVQVWKSMNSKPKGKKRKRAIN